jgi:hypothetical protein
MFAKASYLTLSLASLGLLLFEAPRGTLLTLAPERGKVERSDQPATLGSPHTVRSAYFVFVGGFHGGK